MESQSAVIVDRLSKSYGKQRAVNDISFTVGANEIFALIGPNGAGKSTTLRMLATLLTPTGGKASIYGNDIQKDGDAVRRLISYLPEEAGAYKNISGRSYLKLMAELSGDDSSHVSEQIEFASRIADLGTRLDDKVKTYSKGMTRKLLLARTVMTRPKLAILDEPTSGLDVLNAMAIRKTVREMAKGGMAVLLSSHNMLEIEFLSDRVGIIHQGKIHETGTAAALKEKYKASNLEEVFAAVTRQ